MDMEERLTAALEKMATAWLRMARCAEEQLHISRASLEVQRSLADDSKILRLRLKGES